MPNKIQYERKLMHIQPIGAAFFVTWRLHGSLPKEVYQQLRLRFDTEGKSIRQLPFPKERNEQLFALRKRQFQAIDNELDKGSAKDICNISDPILATIIKDQLHRFDKSLYNLLAYCIMPNHVHLILDTAVQLSDEMIYKDDTSKYKQLESILHRIKGASSRYINLSLGRSGKLWQEESYDIYIRNEIMLRNVISYVLDNPVKAGLSKSWDDYPHSYLKDYNPSH